MKQTLMFMCFALAVSLAKAAPSPKEAKDYIADLDNAARMADAVLKQGDLKTVSNHSKKMRELQKEGEKFGENALAKPYGVCLGAGIFAKSWWDAKLYAAQKGQERTPNEIKDAWTQYQDRRKGCLETAKNPPPETEYIASTSKTPPRKGCLAVLGVLPNGEVGTEGYTCPKK